MAFGLPPSWDPGFALPDNVRDEGLQRRAFVTKQMPRGTYDQPTVGTGGYNVPQYVKDEGYGQGTFTTQWAPSGLYVGPKVPHWLNRRPQVVKQKKLPGGGTVSTIALGGDAPLPAAYEDYGAKAAATILSQVSSLPPTKRVGALKAIMAKIDPSLWARTQDITRRYRAQGMTAAQAFQLALARAMSTGIAAEVIKAGLSRSAPQANSLLGLGCYGGRAALGADAPGVILGSYQTAPTCAAPAGYKWDGTTWVRLKAGEAPQLTGAPCGAGGATATVTTNDQRGVSTSTGVTPYQWMNVGPLQFTTDIKYTAGNDDVKSKMPDFLMTIPSRVPSEVIGWLRPWLSPATGSTYTITGTDYLSKNWPEPDAGAWFQALGLVQGSAYNVAHVSAFRTASQPIARIKHPVTGADLALYAVLSPVNLKQAWNATTNPTALKFWLVKVPDTSFLKDVWDALIWIAATVTDVISDTLDELGSIACDLMQNPLGAAGAAVAAGAAGAPPQAGIAGATIAKNACGSPPPPVLPPMPASIMPTLLLAGGAVLAVALFTKKKKTTP